MKKNPFLIFSLVVAVLVTGALLFIQSRPFARVFKQAVYRYLPRDMGIDADFSEFAIKMFPPGISLKNPVVTLHDRNALNMPGGSKVSAERIDFDFKPLQMFTGKIRVNEVTIVNGDVRLIYDPQALSRTSKFSARKAISLSFNWDELLQIRAEAVGLQNCRIRVDQVGSEGLSAELNVKTLRLAQWFGKGGLGYEVAIDLQELKGSITDEIPILKTLESLKGSAQINALGVQVESIALRGDGLDISGEGSVKGNIQNPKNGLALDGKISASGQLAEFIPRIDSKIDARGAFKFEGRVRGNLEKISQTLRLDGKLGVSDLRFRKFEADRLEATGSWASADGGGELSLEKAVLTAKDRNRAQGVPASGGKLTVNALHYKLGSSDPIKVSMDLERAHLHWLASMGLTDLKPVFGVLLRASGSIDAEVKPPSKTGAFDVKTQVALDVQDFQLDNQRINKVRPLHKIFAIPQIRVEGPLQVDSKGARLEGVIVSAGKTRLRLSGSVGGKTGFALHANGPANLEDIGQIAENDIRGEGMVTVMVNGPAERVIVDVDVDAKDASYLRLHFGDVLGRVTWDDDPSKLIFRHLRATRGQSEYTADGVVDFGGKNDSIDMNVAVPTANVQDFIQIFRDLTKDLWWFPQSLTGATTGHVKITGGLRLDELQVLAKLNGNSWDYLGERFAKVFLVGGYDRGKYLLSEMSAVKRTGRITGRVSFDEPTRKLDWDFHTHQMTLSDLDHMARLDVPVRARIFVDSTGSGKIGALQAETQIGVADTNVRGVAMPPSQLTISSANGVHRAKGSALGNEGTLDLVYDFNPANASVLKAEMRHLDFSPMLLLLNPKLIPDTGLVGVASGSVNLSFHAGQFERASGNVSFSEYVLAKSGTRFSLAEPISVHSVDGSFDVPKLSLLGPRGEAQLALHSERARINGEVSGGLDLSILEFLTPSVTRASGLVGLEFALDGTIKEPLISGRARPKSATLWVNGLESPFENIVGTLEVRQNVIEAKGLDADLAGGRVKSSGKVTLFANRVPELALKSLFYNSKLKIFPFQFVKVDGSMLVTGDHIPYLVEGDFSIDSALSKEKVLQQKQGPGLKVAQYTPPPSSQKLGDYPLFKLKINVKGDKNILVQNDLFDAELKAQVQVVNTIEAPRIVGNVDLIQGKMIFKDRAFQIQSANGVFDNPAVINPKFNLTARTDVNGVKVQLYAAGSLDDYKVELSSTPVMSETDILSLLALGVSPSDTKRLGQDRGAFEQGEAASLLLHSLDFNREVESKTGLQIQFDESVNSQVGTSAFRPQSPNESTAAPKIVIKRQITKNVDVSYGSTVGVGVNSQREVNAEVKVTPGVSVIGVWDNYETLDTQDKRTSYGLDLKLQKRFR